MGTKSATATAPAPESEACSLRLDGAELLGCDFTSRPTRQKPIVLAVGRLLGKRVELLNLERFTTLDGWRQRLERGAWVGGFDLPFGLPREWVVAQGWPEQWGPCMARYAECPREQLREGFRAFCQSRPAGRKWAHRATDRPAGSSPSMKWVNPPVAWMMHAGLPVLRAAGAWFPAHEPPPSPLQLGPDPGAAQRVALEAYPGLLARELLGRQPYKADAAARQDPARRQARQRLCAALQAGHSRLGLQLQLTPAQTEALLDDARGDVLDAVLCLVQTAWAVGQPGFGLPAGVDPLEGWIISA